MTVLEWLLNSDPAVSRMTKKFLLDQETIYTEEGWIKTYLSFFDGKEHKWGEGIYGPKWVSTFYTLLDLKSLEIDPATLEYQLGLDTLLHHMWKPDTFRENDICVVAMFISMLTYGHWKEEPIEEMLQYLFKHQQPDGGWNCSSINGKTEHSSIHTTLSVLEAFADYERYGYRNYLSMIKKPTMEGQEYMLKRHLLRRLSDHTLIIPGIDQFHYPTRWKYDLLRVLCYLASIQYPRDERLEEGLSILKNRISKGYLNKGTTYSGRLHFKLEEGRYGRMNTLRGLIVLKFYDFEYYQHLVTQQILII